MAPHENRPTRCCGAQNAFPRLARTDQLNPFERNILAVARHFFQTFACPAGQIWIEGFRQADQLFAPHDAAQHAFGTLNTVQKMRIARKSTFKFSNPLCPGCASLLTENERQLTSALAAVRTSQRSAAHVHAMLLTEGNDPQPMLLAMHRLCDFAAHERQTHDHVGTSGAV
ncbi:hypothetical protein [Cognatishimia sp. MH4019]|uniref:hypothetical protein n=1 Tax=Cognatishimia sp. MH4019 TaxID=2854030 RepID=UPI001CD4749C|nr:hypothetical protein [Cognatishimia sp. MH4019]